MWSIIISHKVFQVPGEELRKVAGFSLNLRSHITTVCCPSAPPLWKLRSPDKLCHWARVARNALLPLHTKEIWALIVGGECWGSRELCEPSCGPYFSEHGVRCIGFQHMGWYSVLEWRLQNLDFFSSPSSLSLSQSLNFASFCFFLGTPSSTDVI